MSQELIISSPGNEEELRQVAELERQCSHSTYLDPPSGITTAVIESWGWGTSRYHDRFINPAEADMWVGRIGSIVVGYAGASHIPNHATYPGPYVQKLYVHPAHQNCGYGRMLLNAAETWLTGKGCQLAQLNVATKNTGARRFYEKSGYALFGDLPSDRAYPGIPELIYTKSL